MKHSELQESAVFFTDLKRSIQVAKKRILVQVMIFEMVPAMEEYVDILIAATKRGVEVKIVFDWISERYYMENLDVYPSLNPEKIYKRQTVHHFAEKMYKKMRDVGISVTITNIPSSLGQFFLVGKRNHNKLFIIDNIAWTGGINLITNPNFYIDFMVKMYDPHVVLVIEKYFLNKQNFNDTLSATNEYQFLIDDGQKGKSVIYDKSIALIKNAKKEIIFVSQMLPDRGFLNELLKKTKREVSIRVVISNAEHNIFTKFPFRYHYSMFESKVSRNSHIILLHSKQRIHAKLLLVDDKAIFGSHNFAKWNELIGIEETGFLTTDIHLLRQFKNFAAKITT